MRIKQDHYFRHSTVSIQEVVPIILEKIAINNENARDVKHKHVFNGQSVGVSSLRLRTFAVRGTKCSCCGMEATHFAIERNRVDEIKNGPYHLNLYGTKSEGDNDVGEEVIFTHDHTLARGLGGKDNIDNTTTMCGPCNWIKGQEEQKMAGDKKKQAA